MSQFKPERVTLTSGETVEVGLITWGAWCRVKERLVEILSGRVVEFARDAGAAGDFKALGEVLMAASIEKLPGLLGDLSTAIDELTDDFVRGCAANVPDNLPAVDWVRVRDAALRSNDIGALVDSEKNFLAEVAGGTMRRLNAASDSDTPDPTSLGGPDGSTHSPAPTAGAPA